MSTGLPIILGTLLFVGVTLFATALGRRLLVWLRVGVFHPVEHGLIAAGLGLGAMQVIPFILFTVGVGFPAVVRIACAILGIALLFDVKAVLQSGWRWCAQRSGWYWWEYFIFSLFMLLLASIYVRAVCPVTDIDALLYHLTIARRFLEEGRFVHLITLTPSNWPVGVESLFSILLSFHHDAPIAIIQFLFGTLTIALVYVYGRRLGGRLCAATAISFLLVQWMFWWEMATGYIDLGTTLFATLMIYALDRSIREGRGAERWELLAAIFAGLAATTKLQGLWVIVALAGLLLLNDREEPFLRRARRALYLGSIASCIVLPWYIRTWVLTGNPVYPMLYSVLGGNEWTAEGWKKYIESYIITDAIATGLPLTPTVVYTTYGLRILAGIFGAALVVHFTKQYPHKLLARFIAFFTACILLGSATNMRFLLPALPAFAVTAAVALQRWRAHLAPVVCGVASILAVGIAIYKVVPAFPIASKAAFGLVSRDEYMRSDSTITDFDVAEFANRNLPKDSRILLCLQREHTALYSAKAYWGNYRLQDSFHYDSMERLISDLRRIGITHIVLDAGFSKWYRSHPVWKVRKEIEFPALTTVAHEYGTKLFESNGVALYSINLH